LAPLATLCFLVGTTALHAQFDSAAVLGYVRDSSGAVVPSAEVRLTNIATNITVTMKTNKDGAYEFDGVKIGQYRIDTDATGFSTAHVEAFSVTTNARQRVDVNVQAGSVNTSVEVTSTASMLETETSSRATVIGTREVENLPLNGRSYADLVLLVPGARKSSLEANTTSSREGAYNINGQRSAFNNFLLDGLDNNNYGTSNQGFANENIPPSPDAVSEFQVATSNYSAEFGRSPGAVINASVRRGSNQYHGRVWDYIRNTNLNAIGPFLATGGSNPKFIRNQFGGTFGAPIWKDHTFVFMDYEGVRQIFNNPAATSTLPSANQRAGLFYLNDQVSAANAINLTNPITGVTYSGAIPTSAMTPFARAVLAALPGNTVAGGNAAGLANNFTITPRGVINDDKGDVRVDHTFNEKWTAWARYSQHSGYIFDPPSISGRAGGNSNGNTAISNRDLAGGATWAMAPNKLLDVRFGWSVNKGGKTPVGAGDTSIMAENGITDGFPTDKSLSRDLNTQSITGYTAFGAQNSNPQFQNPTIYNPKANFTWVKSKHSLKFGYEFQAVQTQVNDFNPSYGADTYSGVYATTAQSTAVAAAIPASQLQQARNLADFLFGNRSAYSLTNYNVVNLRQMYNFMYVQDDWKASPNLTINMGLRYELVTPQYERDNKLANFDPTTNTLIQAKPGSTYNRALVNTPTKNVGPRFGFAYSADPKTVIRGGYGIVYTQWNRAGGENNLTYNGPTVVNATINQVTPSAASLCTTDTQAQSTCFRQTQQGYSNILVSPSNFNPLNVTTRYIPKNFNTGYVQSYNAGFERQLPGGYVVDLAYVGNKSTHLQTLADYNQGAPCVATATVPCGSLQQRRPIATFGSIEIAYGIGSANYNSLQFKVEKRTQMGLYLLNAFNYSRAFDISSGHLETAGGDNSRVDYNNPRASYGASGYDQPLNDTLSAVYDLPYGHGRRWGSHTNRITDIALGGWQLTLINTMTSGLPVNLNYSLSTSSSLYGSSLVTYRPSYSAAGGSVYAPASGRVRTNTAISGYYNKAALALPTTSGWGNVGRNTLRSTAFYQADLGLHKAFALWSESSKLDFRAEAFNVLNKVNLGQPDGNFSNSTFGSVTTNFPARQLQLAAKIIF
jgi:hypothetical protein